MARYADQALALLELGEPVEVRRLERVTLMHSSGPSSECAGLEVMVKNSGEIFMVVVDGFADPEFGESVEDQESALELLHQVIVGGAAYYGVGWKKWLEYGRSIPVEPRAKVIRSWRPWIDSTNGESGVSDKRRVVWGEGTWYSLRHSIRTHPRGPQ